MAVRKIKVAGKTKRKIDAAVFLSKIAGVSPKQVKKLRIWLKKHDHNMKRVPAGIIYLYPDAPGEQAGIAFRINKNPDGKEIIAAECKFCGKKIDLTDYKKHLSERKEN
ncbi:hypothetical protein M1513_00805 [Patescibacteria group bacterium]|nr:hypothetical protein [Patescibacteria group bacterium]